MQSPIKYILLSGFIMLLSVFSSVLETVYLRGFLPIPFFRIGIANVFLIVALYILPFKYAFLIFVGKVFLPHMLIGTLFTPVFFTSAIGTIFSFILMAIYIYGVKKPHVLNTSMLGAISHSIGQIIAVIFILKFNAGYRVFYFFILFSFPAGFIVGILAFKLLLRYRDDYMLL